MRDDAGLSRRGLRMRRGTWAVVVVGLSVFASGCASCGGTLGTDGGGALSWPPGARLEVVATTSTTALLQWPAAQGPVSGYHLTLVGRGTTEATGTSFLVDGLVTGQHLSASVVAYSSAETTGPLHAEVAGATPLQVPDGDISLDFCQANTFLKQGTADIPCNTLSVLLGHVLTQEGSGVPGLTVSVLNHPEFGSLRTTCHDQAT